MFSTEESLRRRTGPLGTGRLKYLQAMVTEYQDTSEKGISQYLVKVYVTLVGLQKTNFRLLPIWQTSVMIQSITDSSVH